MDSQYRAIISRILLKISFHLPEMGSECPLIFCDNQDSQLGFDVFAAIFWMLSRAEEYGSKQKDQHGRFISVQSLMHTLQSNKIPVVDYWSDAID
jgi:hypothetical protein